MAWLPSLVSYCRRSLSGRHGPDVSLRGQSVLCLVLSVLSTFQLCLSGSRVVFGISAPT